MKRGPVSSLDAFLGTIAVPEELQEMKKRKKRDTGLDSMDAAGEEEAEESSVSEDSSEFEDPVVSEEQFEPLFDAAFNITADSVDLDGPLPPLKSVSQSLTQRIPGHLRSTQTITEPQTVERLLLSYQDIWFSNQTQFEEDAVFEEVCRHITRHLVHSHNVVHDHNVTLKNLDDEDQVPEYRDQGFLQPKVLILAPFRHSAYRFIEQIKSLLPDEMTQVIDHKQRFDQEFGPQDHNMTIKERNKFEAKPEDYKKTFAGNIDDCFRIGIAFKGQKVLKLYSDFKKSDIIVASPLGLRTIIGTEASERRELDFLSSIEMLVIDQATVLSMQNFENVEHVFSGLNKLPFHLDDTDFSRVREWCLEGHAKRFRQTVLLSDYQNPDFMYIFNKECSNHRGKCLVEQQHKGNQSLIKTPVRQIFHRFNASTIQSVDDERFEFFTKDILPNYHTNDLQQTIIFVPSYFDFVRVRNFFTKKKYSFGICSEYAERKIVDRSRSFFKNGQMQYLLVTERFLFFRRYKLSGAHNIIYYGPPEYPLFYPDLLNSMESNTDHTALILFSKYDSLALERIVGFKRAGRLVSSEQSTYLFC